MKSKRDISGVLMGLTNVFCAEARHIQSARLCAFAVILQSELGGLPIADAEDVNKIVAMLKINMEGESYQKEFAIGAAMQQEQAIAYAVENRE